MIVKMLDIIVDNSFLKDYFYLIWLYVIFRLKLVIVLVVIWWKVDFIDLVMYEN